MGTIVVMKDGIVQQVDSPINLYEKPVNKFVGGSWVHSGYEFLGR
ncbi:MAG: hypothetical protein R2865_09450 [Deinococcales bacterium]